MIKDNFTANVGAESTLPTRLASAVAGAAGRDGVGDDEMQVLGQAKVAPKAARRHAIVLIKDGPAVYACEQDPRPMAGGPAATGSVSTIVAPSLDALLNELNAQYRTRTKEIAHSKRSSLLLAAAMAPHPALLVLGLARTQDLEALAVSRTLATELRAKPRKIYSATASAILKEQLGVDPSVTAADADPAEVEAQLKAMLLSAGPAAKGKRGKKPKRIGNFILADDDDDSDDDSEESSSDDEDADARASKMAAAMMQARARMTAQVTAAAEKEEAEEEDYFGGVDLGGDDALEEGEEVEYLDEELEDDGLAGAAAATPTQAAASATLSGSAEVVAVDVSFNEDSAAASTAAARAEYNKRAAATGGTATEAAAVAQPSSGTSSLKAKTAALRAARASAAAKQASAKGKSSSSKKKQRKKPGPAPTNSFAALGSG